MIVPPLLRILRKLRASFVVPLLVLALSCTAILWILNILAVVQGPWATILSVLFTVVSILIALLQWLFPLDKNGATPPSSTPPFHGVDSAQNQHLFGLTPRKGAVLIRVPKSYRGASIHLYHSFHPLQTDPERVANVVERPLAGPLRAVAIFPALHPGNYTLRIDGYEQEAQITVLANQLAEIDWRGISHPASRRLQPVHRQMGRHV